MQLRDDQRLALGKSEESLAAGTNRQLMSIATGWGKGALFAAIHRHHRMEGRVAVLVHTDELAQQAEKKLHQWNPGMMIGMEMAQRRATPMDTMIVGSVPTLGRKGSYRIKEFYPGDFCAVISDEVHHLPGDTRWQRVLDHFGLNEPGGSILSLGLTATPNRSDGKGLRPWFDQVVFDRSILDCINMGFLCDLKGYRVDRRASLDNVRVQGGKFNDAELSKEINTPHCNALVVKAWMQHAWNLRTLVFTQNVQHALDMAEAFKSMGVPAAAVWGEDPERAKKIAAHRCGELVVLLNAQLLREGYDDPEIRCVVLAAPHLSALPYAQEVGRVTRIPDDVSRLFGDLLKAREAGYPISKEFGIVLDITDNSTRHPLVTLPSLLGLPKDLDLKGEKYTVAREKLERVAKEFPQANVQDIKSLSQLKSIAENISLFSVQYPPEVSRLSELAWRKSPDGYAIAVNRDLVTVTKDLREEWQVRGRVGDKVAEFSAQNLAGAMNLADKWIIDSGGIETYLKRDARWKGEPPTEKQIRLARILGLTVPPGATKGQVSSAIDAKRMAMGRPTQ